MSWMRYMTLYSFRKLNPDWEIRLYSPKTVGKRQWKSWEALDAEDYSGPDYSSRLPELNLQLCEWVSPLDSLSPTHAADLFRLDYLRTDGGWYSDLDVLWVRPMEEVYHRTKDCDFVGSETFGIINVALLAGTPNNLWHGLYNAALSGYQPGQYQSMGVDAIWRFVRRPPLTGWETVLLVLGSRYPSLKLEVLPHEIGCPYTFKQVDKIFLSSETVPDDCVCIHWFGGHPISQKWNNILNEKNYSEFPSTYTEYAREILAL